MKLIYKALLGTLLLATTLPALAAEPLSEEAARTAIAPFYQALNATPNQDAAQLVLQATADNWESCSAEDICKPRDKVAPTIAGFSKIIPDLKWEIKEVLVSGNRVTVRGEATGTPAGEFMGVDGKGKSFKLMSIDIHTIENGKMSGKTYHIEDWASALRQLKAQ